MKFSIRFGLYALIPLVFFAPLAGCSSMENLFRDSVMDGDSNSSGNASGGNADSDTSSGGTSKGSSRPVSGSQWNQLILAQAQVAFTYAFSAGGLWAGQVGYNPVILLHSNGWSKARIPLPSDGLI